MFDFYLPEFRMAALCVGGLESVVPWHIGFLLYSKLIRYSEGYIRYYERICSVRRYTNTLLDDSGLVRAGAWYA